MKGLVVSSGEIKNYNLLRRMVLDNDFIICADGGVNHILKIGKLPDMVMGDLDSIGKEELDLLEAKKIKIKKYPAMKDKTDTELCIDFLISKDFKEISLIGVTGTRLDHTIANIYLLRKIYSTGAKGNIVDNNNSIVYIEDVACLERKPNTFVSIIPVSETGAIVSVSGFLYSLNNEKLSFGSTRGISNKVIEDYGKVEIHDGSALIIESKD